MTAETMGEADGDDLPAGVITDAVIGAGALQQFVDTLRALVSEARIHFDDEGVHVRAVGSANIGMVCADLSPDAFESYTAPGRATIGVNLSRLAEVLGVANSGDLVTLSVDMETRSLDIQIRHITQSMGLYDPDSIRGVPNLPDIADNMDAEIVVESSMLTEAVKAIDMTTDHLWFEGVPEQEVVIVAGEGDVDETTETFNWDDLQEASINADAKSLLSIEYVTKIVSPIPSDADVTVEFGDEYPVQFRYEAAGGALSVHNIIAPRIKNS